MNWSISYGKSVPMAEYNNLCTRIDNLSASYTEKRLECERLIKSGNAQRDEREDMARTLNVIYVWAKHDSLDTRHVMNLIDKTQGRGSAS